MAKAVLSRLKPFLAAAGENAFRSRRGEIPTRREPLSSAGEQSEVEPRETAPSQTKNPSAKALFVFKW